MATGRVIHLVPHNRWSDVAKYSLDLCLGLTAAGRSVTAYTCNAVALDRPFAEHGIDLRHAPMHGLCDVATAGILARHFRHEAQHTVVHTHRFRDAFCAIVAARIALRPDIKVVITRHIPRTAHNSWIYRMIYRNIDAFIFTSEKGRREFLSTWKGDCPIPAEKLHVVRPSIPDAPATPWPEPATGPIIARYAGLPAPGCGLETLIDVLPQLRGRRIRLNIPYAPDPDYSDTLRQRAEEIGCADLIDWKSETSAGGNGIRQSHICILPSGRANTFLDTELECLAGGRPVIAPGRERSGWCVGIEADDTNALADAIIHLGTDAEMRHKVGMRAFARFHSHHSWSDYMDAMTGVYEKFSLTSHHK